MRFFDLYNYIGNWGSLIESSMSHWSTAAEDQFKILFHMFEEEMAAANKSHIAIGDSEIDAFVK